MGKTPDLTVSYMARHRTVVADAPGWPPAVLFARQGEFPASRGPRAQSPGVPIRMSPLIDMRDDEELLEAGEQLHELCQKRGILHLIMRVLSQMSVSRVATMGCES